MEDEANTDYVDSEFQYACTELSDDKKRVLWRELTECVKDVYLQSMCNRKHEESLHQSHNHQNHRRNTNINMKSFMSIIEIVL